MSTNAVYCGLHYILITYFMLSALFGGLAAEYVSTAEWAVLPLYIKAYFCDICSTFHNPHLAPTFHLRHRNWGPAPHLSQYSWYFPLALWPGANFYAVGKLS